MRAFLAGLLILLFSSPVLAADEAEGEVESIGFNGMYRPNCWTPIKVRLRSKIGAPATYRLGVVQEDLDRDRVTYWRPITLTGNAQGQRNEERAWVYFLPQPRDWSKQPPKELLKIYLFSESGSQLLPINVPPGPAASMRSLDGLGSDRRRAKLVLMIGSSVTSKAFTDIYTGAHGLMEEVEFVRVQPAELPTNVLGYHAVDAIVWMDSDPAELTSDLSSALEDYVRDGGRLIITQNPQLWQKMMDSPLAPLMPVTIDGTLEEDGLRSLRRLADLTPRELALSPFTRIGRTPIDPWKDTLTDQQTRGRRNFTVVRSTAKPGAVVSMQSSADPKIPYLVRQRVGMGSVTWVAQDFGDPTILSRDALFRKFGWERVWEKVFDWRNEAITPDMGMLAYRSAAALEPYTSDVQRVLQHQAWARDFVRYTPASAGPDLSQTMLEYMEHGGRGAALVALAVMFFIGYWLLAGPGTYFFLQARKRTQYSWTAFAACAVAATVVTVLVVKVVLRGPPQVKHVTLMRIDENEEAIAHSQIGLYVPRNENVRVELKETAPRRVSYVAPYAAHPAHVPEGDTGFLGYMEYESQLRDRNTSENPRITVPFRSSLKKLQAKWVGKMPGITGRAGIETYAAGPSGILINETGRDLSSIHIVYALPARGSDDQMIRVMDKDGLASLPKGGQIDLRRLWAGSVPDMKNEDRLAERIQLQQWVNAKRDEFLQYSSVDPYRQPVTAALLLSVYSRLRPVPDTNADDTDNRRFEIHRLGSRHWDASHLISAGYMLVLAKADGPIPYPMEVQGNPAGGQGDTFYQFIVPMQRTANAALISVPNEEAPATQPAKPADTPVERAELFGNPSLAIRD